MEEGGDGEGFAVCVCVCVWGGGGGGGGAIEEFLRKAAIGTVHSRIFQSVRIRQSETMSL